MIFPHCFFPKEIFFVVLGLGKSGWALAEFLENHGLFFGVWDQNTEQQEKAQKKKWLLYTPPGLYQENSPYCHDVAHGNHPYGKKTKILVISPGVSLESVAHLKKDSWHIMGDVQLFFLFFPDIKAIGVTGSNGKSTLCSLLAQGLKNAAIPHVLGGNIGIPLFSLGLQFNKNLSHTISNDFNDSEYILGSQATIGETVDHNKVLLSHHVSEGGAIPHNYPQPTLWNEETSSHPLYIIELSSYQLETCYFLPLFCGVVLNLYSHHLERHKSMENYMATKGHIFSQSTHCFLPENLFTTYKHVLPKPKALFSFFPPEKESSLENLAEFLLKKLGIDKPDFSGFQPLSHRQEIVAQWKNIVFINDSKATNPKAASFALEKWCHKPVFWLVGGACQQDNLQDVLCKPLLLPSLYPYNSPEDPNNSHDINIKYPEQYPHGGFTSLEKEVFSNIQGIFAFGHSSSHWTSFLNTQGFIVHSFSLLEECIYAATKKALDFSLECIVLFSPGAASFDYFTHFEHRGDSFKKIILKIIEKK